MATKPGLSFITMLAYDYPFAFAAIESYYALADEIILGVDAERLSWTRQAFHFDMDEVRAYIERLDIQRKVRVVEGDFHGFDHPMDNERHERAWLAQQAVPGNWIVQIDSDEILMNGPEFKAWLLAQHPTEHNVFGRWVSVFKTFGEQVLVIDPPSEIAPVATFQRGEYKSGRATTQQGVLSPLHMLHFSWGRTAEQVRQKLENWGHARDLDTGRFFDLWNSVSLSNFEQLRDFHPFKGSLWRSLKLAQLQVQRDHAERGA